MGHGGIIEEIKANTSAKPPRRLINARGTTLPWFSGNDQRFIEPLRDARILNRTEGILGASGLTNAAERLYSARAALRFHVAAVGLSHCPSKFQITASAAISSMHTNGAASDAVRRSNRTGPAISPRLTKSSQNAPCPPPERPS